MLRFAMPGPGALQGVQFSGPAVDPFGQSTERGLGSPSAAIRLHKILKIKLDGRNQKLFKYGFCDGRGLCPHDPRRGLQRVTRPASAAKPPTFDGILLQPISPTGHDPSLESPNSEEPSQFYMPGCLSHWRRSRR